MQAAQKQDIKNKLPRWESLHFFAKPTSSIFGPLTLIKQLTYNTPIEAAYYQDPSGFFYIFFYYKRILFGYRIKKQGQEPIPLEKGALYVCLEYPQNCVVRRAKGESGKEKNQILFWAQSRSFGRFIS